MNKKLANEALNRLTGKEFKSAVKTPVVIVLDNVRSAQNVGSVFRTSDAFRLEKIFLCGITPTPPSREMNKTALGATESVEWEYFADTNACLSILSEKGFECIAVEQTEDSEKLGAFKIESKKKYALVMGNEVDGVEQEVIDRCNKSLEIPQIGTKHSINISVCAGITIWEFYRQLKTRE
ncbi:MAG: 23S rRNA (guanosine2251-2'-O)-methyltransferase [Cryomorphaceae bacterium]|jgi:tRNA G18 (ribose-2'-O)-methylase SpoU